MPNEKRLIDANTITNGIGLYLAENAYLNDTALDALQMVADWITDAPTIDAVALPCKIGDTVWAIRSFHGIKHPQEGIVSEMLFTNDMKLQIVVKYVARGEWGKEVFPTCKDAQEAIDEQERSGASWCE